MSALISRINRISHEDRRFIGTVVLCLLAWTANVAVLLAALTLDKAASWLPAGLYADAQTACWALTIVGILMLPLPFAITHYGMRNS